MALILSDRVKETTITSGTGSVVLTGALGGFQTFNSAIGNGNTTYYVIENDAQFEVGIGTYTSSSNSLSRDTVLKSSSGGSKIDLSAVSFVFCSLPADKILSKNVAGDFAFTGDVSFNDLHCTTISGQDITSTGEVIANNITSSGSMLSSGLLTLKRTDAGNFFHAYVDDANDRTIGLYSDATSAPEWRLGLKSNPNSVTVAPDYAYIFAEDGNIGLVANSLNSMSLTHGGGFSVTNKSDVMFTTASATGTSVNSYAAAYPVVIVKATAAQAANLQEWQNNAGTIFANVANDGSINTSGTLSADNGLLLNDLVPNSTTNKIYNDGGTLKFNGSSVGGGGGGGGGDGSAADILANSASGTATNTSVTNLTTELRTESASGVAISGWVVTHVGGQSHGGVSEGAAYSGGTSSGIVYVDTSGNLASDGPTVSAAGDLTVGGTAVLGEWSISDWMVLRQNDQAETTGYALVQSPLGATTINGKSNTTMTFQLGGANALMQITSTKVDVTGAGELQAGILSAIAPAATDVPLVISAAASQSANLLEVNSWPGLSGDLLAVDKDGAVTFADGTAALPSIHFKSDTDTGFSYEGPSSIQFSAAGTKIIQIDNVGIRSVYNGGAEVATTFVATSTAPVFRFRSDTNTGIGSAGADQISLITSGVEAVGIDASQNATFSGKLTVAPTNAHVRITATASSTAYNAAHESYQGGSYAACGMFASHPLLFGIYSGNAVCFTAGNSGGDNVFYNGTGVTKITTDGTTLGAFEAGILSATAPAATDVPLVISAAAAQSANLLEVNSWPGLSGNLLKVDSAGATTVNSNLTVSSLGSFGGYGIGSATLAVQALNASTKVLNLRGAYLQTADYLNCLNSANTSLMSVNSSGDISAGKITASGAVISSSSPTGYSAANFMCSDGVRGYFVDTNGTLILVNGTDSTQKFGLTYTGKFHGGNAGVIGFSNGNVNGSIRVGFSYGGADGVMKLGDGDQGTSTGELQAGILKATAPAATDVPLVISAAAAQSANLFEVNSWPGLSGNLLKVDKDGYLSCSGVTFFDHGKTITSNSLGIVLGQGGTCGLQLNHGGNRLGYWHWDAITVRSDAYIGFAPSTTVPQGQGDANFKRVGTGNIGVYGSTSATLGELTASGVNTSGVYLPSHVPASTTHTLYNDGGTLKFNGSAVGGGGGSGSGVPGGSNTQVQFNDSSSFGGDADLVWNKTTNALTVNGSVNATTKSFLIDHPTKEGAKLQYASLEGPEHGVYVRGQTSENIIELPEYWSELVDEDSITAHITPVKHLQPNIFVESWDNHKVVLSSDREIMVHYTIYGERKDVDKLKVEWR